MRAPSWPTHLVDEAEAWTWVRSVLPGQPAVSRPTILHTKDWGVTARFPIALDTPPTPSDNAVIFKASCLSLFANAPRLYSVLSRYCAETTPVHIASTVWRGQAWSLFQPVTGDLVRTTNDLRAIIAMARTLAQIQATVAAVPVAEMAPLPHQPLIGLPSMFDALIGVIEDNVLAIWRVPGGVIAQGLLPSDIHKRLIRVRPWVVEWTATLVSGGWPDSVDHVDFHTSNAVVQADGRVAIFDWEEAVIGLPFFSLDRLLDDAGAASHGTALIRSGRADEDVVERARVQVREAYLAALPWRTYAARQHAFDLAMRLAPIKTAYEDMIFQAARGTPLPARRLAGYVAKALGRWQEVVA